MCVYQIHGDVPFGDVSVGDVFVGDVSVGKCPGIAFIVRVAPSILTSQRKQKQTIVFLFSLFFSSHVPVRLLALLADELELRRPSCYMRLTRNQMGFSHVGSDPTRSVKF